RLGYADRFGLLDREDSKEVMASATADLGYGVGQRRFPRADALVDLYSTAVNTQRPLAEVIAAEAPQFIALEDEILRVARRFAERHPGCQELKLVTNYRSTPPILALANSSIACNRKQFHKELQAHREGGVLPALVPLRDVNQQAEFVAQRVLELREEGIPLGEMAVLYRAHTHSMELQMELARRGIPFRVRAGVRFFEQAHI